MNKQGPGTMIDWTDWTWNPISGCLHGCPYCYLRRRDTRFHVEMDPAWHVERLIQPAKKRKTPFFIFTGSSGDMWGEWVDARWIKQVLLVCEHIAPWHTYQMLTKNPSRYGQFHIPDNCWVGTTVDGTARTRNNIEDLVIGTNGRCNIVRFVSFEPLLEAVKPDLFGISWVIIGADSTRGAARPPMEWADTIVEAAREAGIPVWVKDNYGYPKRIKDRLCVCVD